MKPLTTAVLIKCGASPAYAGRYTDSINANLAKYGVTTYTRLAHFLSQILHESIGLSASVENLNYSAGALMRTWKKRFPTLAIANQYAHQPQKIANYVYANRLGNGSVDSGDGWTYRGRGPMQLTGKDKYKDMSKVLNVDFVVNPDLLCKPEYGIVGAFEFWKNSNLNRVADGDNCVTVTRVVNGGENGLADRQQLLVRCKAALLPLFS